MKHIQQIPVLAWFLLCWYVFVTGALLTTIWNPAHGQTGPYALQIVAFLLLEGLHLSLSLCLLSGRWTKAVRSRVLILLAGGCCC